MSKTLLYLVILLILGFGVWFFLFSDKSGELFRSSDSAFTIRDTGSIGKIFLSSASTNESVLLERKENGWTVNKEYPVLESTLRNLLTTLANQQALHPATQDAREGIIRNLAGVGIKVEVYDRQGEKMRVFYVGGELARFAGTAMLMEGSERPYVVTIPGFDGYLTPKYTPRLNIWRDRLVFDLQPEQITRVNIHYPLEPLNSFTLTQQNGKFAVALDSGLTLNTPLNEARVRAYLKYFSKIYCEAYLTEIPELDSIVAGMPPKAVIDLQGTNNYHKIVNVSYYPMDERSRNYTDNPATFEDRYNNDRYFAILNGGKDTVTVPVASFEKIFRRGYEFFMPTTNPDSSAAPALPPGMGMSK